MSSRNHHEHQEESNGAPNHYDGAVVSMPPENHSNDGSLNKQQQQEEEMEVSNKQEIPCGSDNGAVIIGTKTLEEKAKQQQPTEQDDDDDNINNNNNSNSNNDDDDAPENPCRSCPSHFRNPEIAAWIRWCLPLAIVGTLGLLLASDIGSGVQGVSQLISTDPTLFPSVTRFLLHASVFTSVARLWDTGSYALAVFICVTSISWPYVKLLLSLYSWIVPFDVTKRRRRERLIEWLDMLGKWSFVDIIVFVTIVVVFRSTINLGGPILEIYVIPKWGIFGFVAATMLSLIETHIILYFHRKVTYQPIEVSSAALPDSTVDEEKNQTTTAAVIAAADHDDGHNNSARGLQRLGSFTLRSVLPLTFLLVASFAVYLAGCIVYTFKIMNTQGMHTLEPKYESVVSIGQSLPGSAFPGTQGQLRWLQLVWFILTLAAPLLSNVLSLLLVWMPWSRRDLIPLFFAAEWAYAWSSAEVLFVSTIFAVVQIPTFGNGLITSGCTSCYVVDSQLLPTLAVLGAGTLCNMVANCTLFPLTQRVLYGPERLRQRQ